MEKLFGIPMDTVMIVLLATFVAVSAVVGVIAFRNRVMLKLGLRNVPRRPSQTVLIVVGLTLATIIITSAFGTGDTVTYSVRSSAVSQLGQVDEMIRTAQNANPGENADIGSVQYFAIGEFERFREALRGYDLIDGLTPMIVETAPVVDVTSQQNKARVSVFGLPASSDSIFNPLDLNNRRVDLKSLGSNEAYLTEEAAKDLDASLGDDLQLFISQKPVVFTLKGLVPCNIYKFGYRRLSFMRASVVEKCQ